LNLASIHEKLFKEGNIKEVAKFIEGLLSTLSNRDYIHSIKEVGYKLIFLSLFYRPDLYLIESEPEIIRGYADLLYIVRADQRRFKIKDIILEFKYVGVSEIGKKGREIREISEEELLESEVIQTKIAEARKQLSSYDEGLKSKHQELHFHKYVLIGIGFERVIGIEL
jgi:hypothetical protein